MQGSHRSCAHPARRLSFAGAAAALLALALTFHPAPVTEAAPTGALSMSPSSASISVGDTIAVTLDISAGTDIHAAEFTVAYNPVVVQVVDADTNVAGTQITPGAFPGTTAVGLPVENSASGGVITYRYEFNSAGVEADGGGTVATVEFLALAPGNANLQWSAASFEDGQDDSYSPTGSAATLMVGLPANSPTPPPTETPAFTATSTPTNTPAAEATDTPAGTASPTATRTPTPASSPTAAASATATRTSAAVGITVVAGPPPQSRNGVDPSQTTRAQGLPSAGNEPPGIQWWRWVFFLAALMLGAAGWFFTFAVHYGDKEPILIDRYDRRRRRRR